MRTFLDTPGSFIRVPSHLAFTPQCLIVCALSLQEPVLPLFIGLGFLRTTPGIDMCNQAMRNPRWKWSPILPISALKNCKSSNGDSECMAPRHLWPSSSPMGWINCSPYGCAPLNVSKHSSRSILRESAQHRVNPMLVTAILFDEIQHSKPGEGCRLLPIRAWSKPMDLPNSASVN